MRTHRFQGASGWKRALVPCVLAVAAIFGLGVAGFAHVGDEPKVQAVNGDTAATTIKTGSGQLYTTTVERVPGVRRGSFRVDLPARQYMAIRLTAVEEEGQE